MKNSGIAQEISWLLSIIQTRIRGIGAKTPAGVRGLGAVIPKDGFELIQHLKPPVLDDESMYSQTVQNNDLSFAERLLLIFSLSNHLMPHLLSSHLYDHERHCPRFPEFAGVGGQLFRGFIPTGQSFLYLYAGDNYDDRRRAYALFTESNFLAQKMVVLLEPNLLGEPSLSGKLTVSEEWVEYFLECRALRSERNLKYNQASLLIPTET